jgi:Effector-associated domain 2
MTGLVNASGRPVKHDLRKGLSGLIRHPQERELRPFLSSLGDTQRQFLRSVVYAGGVGSSKCFIPVVAYAGAEDAIVYPASARASFPNGGILPGNHSTIIRPNDANDSRYLVLKNVIASVLTKLPSARPSPEAQPEPHIAVTPVPATPVRSIDQPSSETAKTRIVRILFDVNEFRNELDRQEIIRFLPPHIGSEVRSNQTARLAIMSLVTACDRFGEAGHLALFEALDVACPPEDPHVQTALVVLRETWDLRPDEG